MSDTSSLPTQDYDSSDSDLVTYVIRLTPHDKFTYEQVAQLLKEEPCFLNYVISTETVPRLHYHMVIQTDPNFNIEDVRGVIRSFIIPFWQDDQFKLPRGFGNKQYNLQVSQDLDGAVSYAVKGGVYDFEGFTEEYIESRKAESFEKKKPSNFNSEYIELSKRFAESNMDIREFMVLMCNLKAKYDQEVSMPRIYAKALSNLIRRDNCASDFVENFLYKQ